MSDNTYRIFLRKQNMFVGTTCNLNEACDLARMTANRMGLTGSIDYDVYDQFNGRAGGGSVFCC